MGAKPWVQKKLAKRPLLHLTTGGCGTHRTLAHILHSSDAVIFQRGSFPTGRRGQYDLTAMVRAYADCLQPGTHSVARVARHYSVPRKTLENYVTGRTSIQTLYRKLEGGGFLQNKPDTLAIL